MLPPGQQPIEGFPRFGTHLDRPPPLVPAEPTIAITGAVAEHLTLPVTQLVDLPRRVQTADFHCVAGWSAIGLRWEGVPFAAFYREVIEASARPDASVTHLVFGGLDGYRSIVTIADALADDVLLAERLNGLPLDDDHGAPVRLVSPSQYGFVSTKHLCQIELHRGEPSVRRHTSARTDLRLRLVSPHPRARVWEEERHRHLPGWALRRVYRSLIAPVRALSERGSRNRRESGLRGDAR